MIRPPEVPSMYAFSSVGDWPTHLKEFQTAMATLPAESVASPQPALGEIVVDQSFFDLCQHVSQEIKYPFGPDQGAVKNDLLTLISRWNPTDMKKSHPDTPVPAGAVVLLSFQDPICYIDNLHYAHPSVYIVGNNLDLLKQHAETIWENLPHLRSAIEQYTY